MGTYIEIGNTDIELIDGDRGENYPHQNELRQEGDCVFLSANNVTTDGFKFDNVVYITAEKDRALRNGKIQRGDIVITTRGTVGNVAYYNQQIPYDNIRINSGMLIVRCHEQIKSEFLYYVLRGVEFQRQIKQIQTGTAQPQLPKSHFIKMKIIVPTIDVQEKIAKILRTIDEKIESNKFINKNLEQQAQALFKEWFIDNPENVDWSASTFRELIQSTLNGDWGKDAPTGNHTEKVYCIRGADIPEVKAGNKGKMPTRYILPKNLANKKLEAGDIVVEISGGSPTQSTGRCTAITQSLLDRYDSSMVCTNFCKAIKPKNGYSLFVYYYWQFLYEKGVFFSYENGTTGIKNLDFTGLIETESIIVPPFDKVQAFDDYCKSIFNQVYANGKQSEQLASLRDTLLPRLMSEEMDVSNIDL